MSMTKKEKAAFDAAIKKAETLAALRWTSPVKKDVLPPNVNEPSTNRYTKGWVFNSYNMSVSTAWSSCIHHGSGEPPGNGKHGSSSQMPICMYSTKAKALAALRHELENKYARDLYEIDKLIQQDSTDDSV